MEAVPIEQGSYLKQNSVPVVCCGIIGEHINGGRYGQFSSASVSTNY